MKPRWLFIDSAMGFGGHEVMLLRLMQEITAQGHVSPRLLARNDTPLADKGREWLSDHRLTSPAAASQGKGFARLRAQWRQARTIIDAIRHEQPTLCIVANGHLGYLETVLATRLSGCRCVVYVPLVDAFSTMGYRHGWLKDAVVRYLLAKLPHGWITITPDQARSFKAWARPSGPVHCLPNAVAPAIEHAMPDAAAARVGTHEALRVLVFGRLDAHQKGLDMLMAYLEGHPELIGKLVVSVIGDGPYQSTLEILRERSPALAQLVRHAPWANTLDTLTSHDVLLMPSRFEGVPLVMLEAMALGLPVVASDIPGTRAYLDERCLFAVGDLPAAFEAVFRLKDPAWRNAQLERNRTVFARQCSGHAFAQAVAHLVEKLGEEVAPPVAAPSVTTVDVSR
ncbi:MAG TPA: glycosyltransferase family 4 protein [Rhodocyclaceae bacterium]|nr:glycosyltransferase family 4 protein [Rhodocyclaceae bacterium]